MSTTAEAARASMNLCCCFIFSVWSAPTCQRYQKRRSRQVGPALQNSLHRIITTRTKRLATKQTPHRHATAAQGAVPFDGFARVFGTSRNKTARGWQPRRDYCFVESQNRNQNKTHCQIWSAVASAARHRFGSIVSAQVVCNTLNQSAVAATLCRRTPNQNFSALPACSIILRNSRKRSSSSEASSDRFAFKTQS